MKKTAPPKVHCTASLPICAHRQTLCFVLHCCAHEYRLSKGKAKKTRKFAAVKRMINPNKDIRVKNKKSNAQGQKKKDDEVEEVRHMYVGAFPVVFARSFSCRSMSVLSVTIQCVRRSQQPSSLFFNFNKALGPPYHVLVDTNFINFSIQVGTALCFASLRQRSCSLRP